MQGHIQTSLVTEDKRLEDGVYLRTVLLKCLNTEMFLMGNLYGNETVCSFQKMIFEWLLRKCNEKCNEMKSNQQWNKARKNNQQGSQMKCPSD